jgi:hypothetical protein
MTVMFTCAACGRSFETVTSHADAAEELKRNFGVDYDSGPMEIVCDNCYQEIRAMKPVHSGKTAETSAMIELSGAITRAVHAARAAGLPRENVAGVIQQALRHAKYKADITPEPKKEDA